MRPSSAISLRSSAGNRSWASFSRACGAIRPRAKSRAVLRTACWVSVKENRDMEPPGGSFLGHGAVPRNGRMEAGGAGELQGNPKGVLEFSAHTVPDAEAPRH